MKYKSDLWKKNTIIKDAIHGYISIPKPIMREIIDTETFQRLKNIDQTGMDVLYPSATHNRFTHSLGVYHLSKIAFSRFRKNVKTDFGFIYDSVKNRFVNSADEVWDRWELMFQLASLLHDCGHSPFSHTLEFIYDLPVKKSLNERLTEDMSEQFVQVFGYKESGCENCKVCGAPHERMSALFLKTKGNDYFYDKVEQLLKDYISEFLYNSNLIGNYQNIFNDDIEFMIRMIIGCRYQFDKAEKYSIKKFYQDQDLNCWYMELQLRNCIINLLNSKLDVDNLDYVIRDSKYSGYANQNVDVERLLSSFTIVSAFELEDVDLKKEDILDCCVNLKKFEGKYIDARISGSCSIKSHSQDINAHGKIYLEGEHEKSDVTQRSLRTSAHFSAHVKFPINDVREHNDKVYISELLGDGKETGICYLNIRGSLEGKFSGTILINDEAVLDKWKKMGKIRIFPAYYQNSMSVLMSAFEGSNFERRWVYAHPVSTFVNNYLNIYLLEKYAQILMNKEIKQFSTDLNQLVEDLENGLTEEKPGKAEQLIEEARHAQTILYNKIEDNFRDVNDRIYEFLEDSVRTRNIYELSELYDVQITFKKIFGKTHSGLLDVINKIVTGKKSLVDNAYQKLKDFNQNKKYLRLRGREAQYFWDIVAMCESKSIMGQNFYKSTDEDLMALYKQEYLTAVESDVPIEEKNSHTEFSENFEYLTKRNYMRCMWKSYPEYQFYIRDWTNEEIRVLDDLLKPHTVPKGYGYLVLSDTIGENRASDLQKKFWEYLKKEYRLKRFVSVNQSIKTKQFTPYETYMKRDKQVIRLEDIGLFSSQKNEEKFRFFYYDQYPDGKTVDIVEILNWIRKEAITTKDKKDEKDGSYRETSMKKEIIIRDNIYGNISIPYKIRQLIDCKEFQRLRRVSQLATAGQVFPGAVQNRFSHSLGVYHLMNKIVTHFEKKLRYIGYENSIKPEDKDAILVAALLHDIGHGPFSHAFEDAGINQENFSHEYWSEKIITSSETDINQTLKGIWGENFPKLVMSYIDCRNKVKEGEEVQNIEEDLNLKFIFASLVSSQLDADRMDYLLRDSQACGVTCGQFDIDRLIEGMSIAINADGELKVGIEEKYLSSVEEYFYARYMMYNGIYFHPYKVLTENLLQYILREACSSYIKGYLKFNEVPPVLAGIFNHATMSLKDFCELDDHVVVGAMQIWANLTKKETECLAMLCRYFLERKGFSKLNITSVKKFCDKFDSYKTNTCKIMDPRSDRRDFICCKKNIQMFKTDQKGDVYIIKDNGIIISLQDIKSINNLKNEEVILYHSMELTEKFYQEDKERILQLIKEFDLHNSVEIEKKYLIKNDVDKKDVLNRICSIIEKMDYNISPGTCKEQTDVYYDTDSEMFKDNDVSVRIRSCGKQRYITCKYKIQSESNGEGGQLERHESEHEIESGDLQDNVMFIDDFIVELLREYGFDVDDLSERIEVKNNRQKFVISKDGSSVGQANVRYELVLDDVIYKNKTNGKECGEVQIEIELKSGYETRINMKKLTDAIENIDALESITQSKYARAIELTEVFE